MLWFFGLNALWLLCAGLAPLPTIPGLTIANDLGFAVLAIACFMLALSYRPIPKFGFRNWILIILVAVALHFAFKRARHLFMWGFTQPAASMEPTIGRGDHVLVWASAYWFAQPKRGELVVFRTDSIEESTVPKGQFYVKRVAGLPEEEIEIKEGALLANGKPISSPDSLTRQDFALPLPTLPWNQPKLFHVPRDSYFVVGDNAKQSLDSRHFGSIPLSSIVGKATKIYWPVSRARDLQ